MLVYVALNQPFVRLLALMYAYMCVLSVTAGFGYAAVTKGTECWCGQAGMTLAGEFVNLLVEPERCSMQCYDDKLAKCGGKTATTSSLYHTGLGG